MDLVESLILLVLLIIISIFDIKTRTIPNFLNFLVLSLVVLRMTSSGIDYSYALAGAFWAFALACAYAYFNKKIDILGAGDIKMFIAIGVAIGPLNISIVFVSSILVAISYLAITNKSSLPMGPVISFFAAFFLF